MLVTFRTKGYPNITMFGDVAVTLLKMMGHSGTVPSAITADDVPAALERLKSAIEAYKQAPPESAPERNDGADEPPPVSLANRAFPLIELLEAAVAAKADVMWS